MLRYYLILMAFVQLAAFHLKTIRTAVIPIINAIHLGVYSFAHKKYTITETLKHDIQPFQGFIRNCCSKSVQIPWKSSSSDTLLAKFETALKDNRMDEAWESFSDYKRLHGLPNQSLISKLIVASSYSSDRYWFRKAYQLVLIILRESPGLLHYDPLSRLALTLARAQIPVPSSTILRVMLEKKMHPTVDVLSSIFFHMSKTEIGSYLAANILLELSENYLQLKEKSKSSLHIKRTKPNIVLFNILLSSSVQFGHIIKAQKLFNLMPHVRVEADANSLVVMSHVYEITGQRDNLRTLENLFSSNIFSGPSRRLRYHFYDCMLCLHFKFNDIDSAANLILGLFSCSKSLHSSSKNPPSYLQKPGCSPVESSNLDVIAKTKMLQTDLVVAMEVNCGLVIERNGKLVPSEKALAKLICGFVRERRVHELSTVLISMHNDVLSFEEPNLCSDVMDACLQLGWLDTMHDILDDMESAEISVDSVHYKSLLRAYLLQSRLDEANTLVRQMKKAGILNDLPGDPYNGLKIFAHNNVDSESQSLAKNAYLVQLLGSESKEDVQSCQLMCELNSSISFFCKSKMMEDSMRTLRKMQERNVQVTVHTFSYLVDGFSSFNMYREITVLWGDIKRRLDSGLLAADRDLFDCLLLNFVRGGYFERVTEIVSYMNQYNMYIDKWKYRREFLMLHRPLYRNLKSLDARTDAQKKRLEHVQGVRRCFGIGVPLYGSFV